MTTPDAPASVDASVSLDAPPAGCRIDDLGGPLGAVVPGSSAFVDVGRVPLVLDGEGNPWIATVERDVGGLYWTFVRRWTGSAWETVGPGIPYGSQGGVGGLPALVLDAQGRPVVASTHYPVPAQPAVMEVVRFDGNAWQDLGLPSTQPSSTVALARAPSGDIVMAWPAIFFTRPFDRLEVATYASGSWSVIADVPVLQRNPSPAFHPSIAFTPAGDTVLAWFEQTVAGSAAYVDRLGSGGVTPVGGALDPVTSDVYPYPSVAVDPAGTIYVAYAPTPPGQYSSGIRVATWTGSAWQNVGDLLPGHEGAAYPPFNLSIHPQTHRPVLGAPYLFDGIHTAAGAWTFDGSSWHQVCSDLIDNAIEISVVVDTQGRYVVVGQPLTGVQTGTTIVRRVTP